jgi:hypothetical protein
MDHLPCPFCDFTDQDSYYLMQHVELTHPENGESPFIVRGDERPDRTYRGEDEEPAGRDEEIPSSHDANESQYVECPYQCGELVPSAELSNHNDFHVAERMALAEAGLPSEMPLSTGPCSDTQAVKDISSHFTTDIPRSLRNLDQYSSSTPPQRHHKKGSSLKDLLFSSPSSPRRRASEVVTDGRTPRLGVSQSPVGRDSWVC